MARDNCTTQRFIVKTSYFRGKQDLIITQKVLTYRTKLNNSNINESKYANMNLTYFMRSTLCVHTRIAFLRLMQLFNIVKWISYWRACVNGFYKKTRTKPTHNPHAMPSQRVFFPLYVIAMCARTVYNENK